MKKEYPEKAIELKAIELLDKYFPKGERFSKRGNAMAILSVAFLEGKENAFRKKALRKRI